MKHKPTIKALHEMLDALRMEEKRSELLATVIALTQHMIEYPPHWQINFCCDRLDRLFEATKKETKTIRDGEW